jgi:hypothetical protein
VAICSFAFEFTNSSHILCKAITGSLYFQCLALTVKTEIDVNRILAAIATSRVALLLEGNDEYMKPHEIPSKSPIQTVRHGGSSLGVSCNCSGMKRACL